MKKLRHVYFVSYAYQTEEFAGIASTTIYRDSKITCEEDVRDVEEFLKKEDSYNMLSVINFILLNKRGK